MTTSDDLTLRKQKAEVEMAEAEKSLKQLELEMKQEENRKLQAETAKNKTAEAIKESREKKIREESDSSRNKYLTDLKIIKELIPKFPSPSKSDVSDKSFYATRTAYDLLLTSLDDIAEVIRRRLPIPMPDRIFWYDLEIFSSYNQYVSILNSINALKEHYLFISAVRNEGSETKADDTDQKVLLDETVPLTGAISVAASALAELPNLVSMFRPKQSISAAVDIDIDFKLYRSLLDTQLYYQYKIQVDDIMGPTLESLNLFDAKNVSPISKSLRDLHDTIKQINPGISTYKEIIDAYKTDLKVILDELESLQYSRLLELGKLHDILSKEKSNVVFIDSRIVEILSSVHGQGETIFKNESHKAVAYMVCSCTLYDRFGRFLSSELITTTRSEFIKFD